MDASKQEGNNVTTFLENSPTQILTEAHKEKSFSKNKHILLQPVPVFGSLGIVKAFTVRSNKLHNFNMCVVFNLSSETDNVSPTIISKASQLYRSLKMKVERKRQLNNSQEVWRCISKKQIQAVQKIITPV